MMTQFVPQNMGFDHITRGEVISNHSPIFLRELLASGDSNIAILLLDCTYIYIEKSSKYSFQRKSYSVYKGRSLVKPILVVASYGYIIDILGPNADGKNNDAAILNKHFSKKENCIS